MYILSTNLSKGIYNFNFKLIIKGNIKLERYNFHEVGIVGVSKC